MQARTITDRITIADQPTRAELEALRGEGYVGVVNLRQDGEPEQPLGAAEEGEAVRALGMDYLHRGVSGSEFPPEAVAAVADFLDAHDGGKVLVHCRKGGRAAALVLLHQARTHGWAADEALDRGAAMGLAVDGKLRAAVEDHLGR